MNEYEVLYIGGFGRNGSTLLSFLLDSHSKICSLGEMNGTPDDFRDRLCRCGVKVGECDFWININRKLESDFGMNIFYHAPLYFSLRARYKFVNTKQFIRDATQYLISRTSNYTIWDKLNHMVPAARELKKICDNNFRLFDLVARETRSKVIVDSSKIVGRMKLFYLTNPSRVKMIYMIRDGRAVMNSFVKYGLNPKVRLKRWIRVNKMALQFLKNVPNEKKYFLKYEDLCSNPEEELKKLMNFINLEFEPNILKFNQKLHHDVGGSPSSLLKTEKIIIDQSWRKELSDENLNLFYKYGLNTQRLLGYFE